MPCVRHSRVSIPLCWLLILAACANPASARLRADQLGLVINDKDPVSVEVGNYYAQQRKIPPANVLHIELPPSVTVINPKIFKRAYDSLKEQTPSDVQAYALTWAAPYRVDCMSITSAFAMGYAKRFCAKGCRATAPNPYFDSSSTEPYNDFGIRPTVALAASTVENAKFLIDRGIQSDFTNPQAKAYLVISKDRARNTRAPAFVLAKRRFNAKIPVAIVRSQGIRNKFDIMFYFTGSSEVPHLDTVGFLPGAMADHLTSSGGRLTDSRQMSALRWLEAGATGSYGTVVEPCNFPQKFPDPIVAMGHYLAGDTLIEAYWKSVIWPGQGIFIGEPLAKPYAQQAPGATQKNSDKNTDE